jgi:endonuclease G, mitochondrial
MNAVLNLILVSLIYACVFGLYGANHQATSYLPKSIMIIEREGYTIAYDGRTRNAFWVYERLTRDSFEKKNVDRRRLHFKPDQMIPLPIRASLDDYRGSGLDLGHLCPFGDCRSKKSAAAETFILSNICPQVPQFNQGHWMKLEIQMREMAYCYQVLHIITMPLYLPLDGWVNYRTLGNNNVHVPTHFCKVIFAEKEGQVDVLAFVLPNAIIPEAVPMDSFKSTLEKVERLSGFVFSSTANRVEQIKPKIGNCFGIAERMIVRNHIVADDSIYDSGHVLPAHIPGRSDPHDKFVVFFHLFMDRSIEFAERVYKSTDWNSEFLLQNLFGSSDFLIEIKTWGK